MVSGFQVSNTVSCDLVGMGVKKSSCSDSGRSVSHGFDPVSGVVLGSNGQVSATV